MHDLDRTHELYESNGYEIGDQEMEFGDEFESYDEMEFEAENAFDEVEEMELASELLNVSNEAELDQFLGKLIKRASRAAGKLIRSPIGRQLGGLIKGAIKKALPIAANFLVPGLGGTLIGSALGGYGSADGNGGGAAAAGVEGGDAGDSGDAAANAAEIFGLELEGLSPQDQEFEIARQIVRFAGDAVRNAAQAEVAPGTQAQPTQAVAQSAIVDAARKHAPGLLRSGAGRGYNYPGRSGRWARDGRKIILFGVYR